MAFLKKSMCFFCGVALTILMADCALSNPQGGQKVQGGMKSIMVSEKDNGSRFELNKGEEQMARYYSFYSNVSPRKVHMDYA